VSKCVGVRFVFVSMLCTGAAQFFHYRLTREIYRYAYTYIWSHVYTKTEAKNSNEKTKNAPNVENQCFVCEFLFLTLKTVYYKKCIVVWFGSMSSFSRVRVVETGLYHFCVCEWDVCQKWQSSSGDDWIWFESMDSRNPAVRYVCLLQRTLLWHSYIYYNI
jgi:hypothetical protein